jgi:hypothetical protein
MSASVRVEGEPIIAHVVLKHNHLINGRQNRGGAHRASVIGLDHIFVGCYGFVNVRGVLRRVFYGLAEFFNKPRRRPAAAPAKTTVAVGCLTPVP